MKAFCFVQWTNGTKSDKPDFCLTRWQDSVRKNEKQNVSLTANSILLSLMNGQDSICQNHGSVCQYSIRQNKKQKVVFIVKVFSFVWQNCKSYFCTLLLCASSCSCHPWSEVFMVLQVFSASENNGNKAELKQNTHGNSCQLSRKATHFCDNLRGKIILKICCL